MLSKIVYTVTLNPAIDYHLKLTELHLGATNDAFSSNYIIGGKGINVTKVLHNLGCSSIALGFIGGWTGKYLTETLKVQNITTDLIEIMQNSRINIKLNIADTETEINTNAPEITEKHLTLFKEKLKKITGNDIVVLAGSIPLVVQSDIYLQIIKLLPKGVKIVVDTRGKNLKNLVGEELFLIKPNQAELEEYCGKALSTTQDIIQEAQVLQNRGIKNIIISRGTKGALLFNKDGIFSSEILEGTMKSTVGAGDSLVGGFIASTIQGNSAKESFIMALACAAATVFSEHLCTKALVEKLIPKVKLKKIG